MRAIHLFRTLQTLHNCRRQIDKELAGTVEIDWQVTLGEMDSLADIYTTLRASRN